MFLISVAPDEQNIIFSEKGTQQNIREKDWNRFLFTKEQFRVSSSRLLRKSSVPKIPGLVSNNGPERDARTQTVLAKTS